MFICRFHLLIMWRFEFWNCGYWNNKWNRIRMKVGYLLTTFNLVTANVKTFFQRVLTIFSLYVLHHSYFGFPLVPRAFCPMMNTIAGHNNGFRWESLEMRILIVVLLGLLCCYSLFVYDNHLKHAFLTHVAEIPAIIAQSKIQ